MRLVLRRILITVLAALFLAAPAGAGTIIVKLTFVPGKLAVRSVPVAASHLRSVQVPVTVADGRGNGSGWTLRASNSAVAVTSVTAHCAANSTCTLPTAVRAASGSVVLEAARGTGMGVMNLTVTIAPLPAGTAAAPVTFTLS
ncbi:MAG: hypothetical protein QOH95_1074 [Gaiellaceae bacterium]|jgi:hypothetical protein|nr:hypothetical protein [Gaiellaceae bacterium]